MTDDITSSINTQLNESIGDMHDTIEADSSLDLNDPENQAKLQQDFYDYTSLMQTKASISEALHNLAKTIAQALAQA